MSGYQRIEQVLLDEVAGQVYTGFVSGYQRIEQVLWFRGEVRLRVGVMGEVRVRVRVRGEVNDGNRKCC